MGKCITIGDYVTDFVVCCYCFCLFLFCFVCFCFWGGGLWGFFMGFLGVLVGFLQGGVRCFVVVLLLFLCVLGGLFWGGVGEVLSGGGVLICFIT